MKMNSQKTVGQQLMLASRLYRARMAEHLAEISIFPGQELVLQALSGTEGATMGELSRALRVRPPTISKTITRLAAQGLVARRSRTDDARIVLVTLTAEGEAKLSRIGELTSLMEEEIADLLDDKDARRLRKLLRRLSKGLAKNPGSTDLDQEGEMPGDDED
ncbi:MAG: MarR family transcriptional regulator [Methylobacterium sp.]|uniref:MarR family winged helix-turn-helix transcriptional regulator n=1 Tax=Rhabdaerophilum sp. TaxID=2717341 RepID=UPI0038D3AB8C|nr:MarR family transcriptional regulator [Methylobacterium sp.]